MCDEFTGRTAEELLAGKGITRREFAAIGAAALAGFATAVEAAQFGLSEATVEVATTDGKADAFFAHPAKGKYPGVIFWPDALGLRDAKKVMARRLAAAGHAVLVVNQYYRSGRAPLGIGFDTFRTEDGRAKMMSLIGQLTPEAVTRDAAAYAAFLDKQSAVDTGRGLGTQGYCMGGPFTVRTPLRIPPPAPGPIPRARRRRSASPAR